MSDDLDDVKADLKRIGKEQGDVLCRAALREIEALEAENERLREALDDAINEAMGVVPESASAFYDYRATEDRG